MFKKALATVAAVATLSSATQAAELQTDVDVTLPSVIALSCYDEIDVNVTAAGFLTAVGSTATATGEIAGGDAGTVTATAAAGELTAGSTELAVGTVDANVNLNMTNICAFRAIGAANGVTVSVAATNQTTLAGPGTTSIAVGTPATRANGGTTFGTTYDVAVADLGFTNVNGIDVQLPLDLTNAGVAGTYDSTGTDAGTFKVTVVGKP